MSLPSPPPPAPRALGLASGVGLVVSEMVGLGILTTTGFMARALSPAQILGAWLVGGLAALAGARAYAEAATLVPRSGGEYRILSDLLHPAAGYVAGWISLLVGFAAPAAAAASGAGVFVERLVPGVSPRAVGLFLLAALALVHGADVRVSRRLQDVLSLAKAGVLVLFVALGLALGRTEISAIAGAAGGDGSGAAFAGSLVFVAYAMSGWNAASYVAEDFLDPRRDVARATTLGCALVLAFYLAVNWVFLANLPLDAMATWSADDSGRLTLAHLVAARLAGAGAAAAVSGLIVLSLVGAVSALTWAGPRVVATMARDGVLPRRLAGRSGRAPRAATFLQAALAAALVLTQRFEALLAHVGVVLTLSSAAAALSLFRARRGPGQPRPARVALAAAVVYAALSAWMLVFALRASPGSALVAAIVVVAGLGAYAIARRRHGGQAPPDLTRAL